MLEVLKRRGRRIVHSQRNLSSAVCALAILSLPHLQCLPFHTMVHDLLVSLSLLRYPHYERYFYYAFCSLDEATHFHVLNYDGQITIVAKQKRVFMIDEERSRVYTCFVNRYMTYVVDKEIVRVSMYDYRERLARIGRGKQR